MPIIMVGDRLVHGYLVLTPEWYMVKDGSPIPSQFSDAYKVGDGTLVMKALATILAVYGFVPESLGWKWKNENRPEYKGPGAGLFTIGYLKEEESSWKAALGFTGGRLILPWDKAKGLPEMSLTEKTQIRRDSRITDGVLIHNYMDTLYLNEEGATKLLETRRYYVREEDKRCRTKVQG